VSTNASGCTHTETLNLTINTSTSNSITLSSCDNYTWSINGTAYTTTGTYTEVSTNASGCTHTETLNLTINTSTSNSTTLSSCDSYTWAVNGTTYTTTGTYTDVSSNASGCTHTETLNLTINTSTSNSTTLSSCDNYTWSINGTAYTTTGTYTEVSTNASGCTHTETLNLTINTSTSAYIHGPPQASQGATESYVPFPSNPTSVYLWSSTLNNINYTSPSGDSIAINFMVSGNELIYFIETTSDGCIGDTVWMQIMVESHTGINQIQIDDINIYPNPSLDIFNIEFSSLITQNLQVKIINSIGEVVFIDNLENYIGEYKKQINLKEYSKAIYLLKIQTNDGIINKKLILQ
jgi:hypothetical protein